jgi:hypothetical protein
VRNDLGRSEINSITAEIAGNDRQIGELAKTPVKFSLWDEEPLTRERDAILQLMARNYQLIRNLQHQKPFAKKTDKGGKPAAPKIAADLVAELLESDLAGSKAG